jgi:hypothetical protein
MLHQPMRGLDGFFCSWLATKPPKIGALSIVNKFDPVIKLLNAFIFEGVINNYLEMNKEII